MKKQMRIGIFGGSFDPIHQGHLILAEQCREQAGLDCVWFMPCSLGPHKQHGAHGTDRQRMEMIELALAGHSPFILSTLEIDRGGISYTVETLQEIKASNENDELFLLMGNDSLVDFSNWREPGKICQLAIPLIASRPGSGDVDLSRLAPFVDRDRFAMFKKNVIISPHIQISSSQIREKIAAGKSVRFLVPRSVEKYAETNALYQSG